MSGKIERFLQDALELAEDARVGKLIIEAARKGTVSETPPESITDDQFEKWAAIRRIALSVLNRYWNEKRHELEIWKGVELVCEEVKQMIAEGKKEGNEMLYWKWEREPTTEAFKITVKRRFNELQSAKFYARTGDLPKAISWRVDSRSYYIPNPHFLSTEVRKEMEILYGERLYGKVGKEER